MIQIGLRGRLSSVLGKCYSESKNKTIDTNYTGK